MKKDNREAGILETLIGVLMDALPIVCAFFIVTWAGPKVGYELFIQMEHRSGSTHTEIVEVTEEEASSALAVGRVLKTGSDPQQVCLPLNQSCPDMTA